jgi:gliding motility-associated-like protein
MTKQILWVVAFFCLLLNTGLSYAQNKQYFFQTGAINPIFNTSTGNKLDLVIKDKCLKVTPDGNTLVAMTKDGLLYVLSFDGIAYQPTQPAFYAFGITADPNRIDISDDGKTIVCTGNNKQMAIYTTDGINFSLSGSVYTYENSVVANISSNAQTIATFDHSKIYIYNQTTTGYSNIQTITVNGMNNETTILSNMAFSKDASTLYITYPNKGFADLGFIDVYTFNGISYDSATTCKYFYDFGSSIEYMEFGGSLAVSGNGSVLVVDITNVYRGLEPNLSVFTFSGVSLGLLQEFNFSSNTYGDVKTLDISYDKTTIVFSENSLSSRFDTFTFNGVNYQPAGNRTSISNIYNYGSYSFRCGYTLTKDGKRLITGAQPNNNLPYGFYVFDTTPILNNNLGAVNANLNCSNSACVQNLTVTSNIWSYSITGMPAWASLSTTAGFFNSSSTTGGLWYQNVVLTAQPNSTSSSRMAVITLTGISYGYTNTFTVFQERPLDVSFTTNTVCSGIDNTFRASHKPLGSTFAYYQWQTPTGVSDRLTSPEFPYKFPVVSVTSGVVTSYQVTLTGYNTVGGSGVAVGTAYVLPKTVLQSLTPTATVCSGMAQTFTASATGTSISYQWAVNSNQLPVSSEQLSVNSYLTTSLAGVYGLTVSGSCGTVTTSTGLTVNSNPPFSLGADSQELWLGERISLSPLPYNNTSIALWNTGETSPILMVDKAGTYTLTLMAAGCPNQTKSISIYTPDCNLLIPSFITPNGDGQNDTWDLTNLYRYPQAQVKVLNRWGEVVKTLQSDSPAWDGNIGNSLKEEVFYYLLDLGNGQPVRKGSLSVLR